MAVKVVLHMKMDGTGRYNYSWTEPHILLRTPDPGESLSVYLGDYRALANARGALLGANGIMIRARASVFFPPGAGKVKRQSRSFWADRPATGITFEPGMAGTTAEPPSNALVCETFGFTDAQRGHIWLTGCPDGLFSTGTVAPNLVGPVYSAVPGWKSRFDAYASVLLNKNWGFLAKDNPPASGYMAVTEWSNEVAAPNRLILTLTLNPPAVTDFANVGDIIQVYDVLTNQAGVVGSINGEWKLVAKTAPAGGQVKYTLANSAGWDAALIRRPGFVSSVSHSIVTYSSVDEPVQGEHKRGGSSAAARGRSRPRRRRLV